MIKTENYPDIQIPSRLQDIFLLDNISDEYRSKNFDTYKFNGIPIPRVSNILKECISKEFLISWAARLGIQQYMIEKNKATTIGTKVHEMIENYLLTGNDLNLSCKKIVPNYIKSVNIAYNNFKLWVDNINNLGYKIEKILAIEQEVTCPYYGGTIDCIMKINGAIYIIDFKTSKQISYEYIIQTCAYMWLINNGFFPEISHIDGVGIIRVDKEKEGKFEDLFLNEYIPYQKEIIDQYIRGFGSLLNSYYNNINMKILFSNYKKSYDFEETILKGVKL